MHFGPSAWYQLHVKGLAAVTLCTTIQRLNPRIYIKLCLIYGTSCAVRLKHRKNFNFRTALSDNKLAAGTIHN